MTMKFTCMSKMSDSFIKQTTTILKIFIRLFMLLNVLIKKIWQIIFNIEAIFKLCFKLRTFLNFLVVLTAIHHAHHAMAHLSRSAFNVNQIDSRWKENAWRHAQMDFMAIKRGKSAFRWVKLLDSFKRNKSKFSFSFSSSFSFSIHPQI